MKGQWRSLFFSLILTLPSVLRAGDFQHGWYPTEWGPLSYRLYVPSPLPEHPSLLVALHGCKEDGEALAAITRLNAAADREGSLVLYPEQDRARNWDLCWNWFLPVNQSRDLGEPAMIADLTENIAAGWEVPRSRTRLLGISSGGAMTAIVGSCYPDRFSAVAIHSGLEYKAAQDLWEAQTILSSGSPHLPSEMGREAAECSGLTHLDVPLILFHGTEDQRVSLINGEQLLAQFAWTNGILRGDLTGLIPLKPFQVTQGNVPGGYSFETSDYGSGGHPLLRKVIVKGLAHAWSGGPPGLPNSDPKGPDATRMIFDFFRVH